MYLPMCEVALGSLFSTAWEHHGWYQGNSLDDEVVLWSQSLSSVFLSICLSFKTWGKIGLGDSSVLSHMYKALGSFPIAEQN